jgi:hypothetical protein
MIQNKSVRIAHNMIGKTAVHVGQRKFSKGVAHEGALTIISVIIIGSAMGGECDGRL